MKLTVLMKVQCPADTPAITMMCTVFGNSKHKNRALENLKLLEDVITFKMKFYPRNWAHYEKSKPGTLRLTPPAFRIKALEEDYKAMQEMFFGEAPTFAELIKYIALLEKDINSLAHTTA